MIGRMTRSHPASCVGGSALRTTSGISSVSNFSPQEAPTGAPRVVARLLVSYSPTGLPRKPDGLSPMARRLPRHFTYWWRMSIYRPRDLLRAITRPPWRFRSTDLDDSVHRPGVPRSTDLGFSVDRPGDFGGPTAALRSTDSADSVDRLSLPPGGLPIPAKGWINTTVFSDQYHGMVGSIRRYRCFLRYRLIVPTMRPCRGMWSRSQTSGSKYVDLV